MLGHPKDMRLRYAWDFRSGRPWEGKIESLGEVLGTLEGDVLGTNICQLGSEDILKNSYSEAYSHITFNKIASQVINP